MTAQALHPAKDDTSCKAQLKLKEPARCLRRSDQEFLHFMKNPFCCACSTLPEINTLCVQSPIVYLLHPLIEAQARYPSCSPAPCPPACCSVACRLALPRQQRRRAM